MSAERVQFEYDIEIVNDFPSKLDLNIRGDAGWELVSVDSVLLGWTTEPERVPLAGLRLTYKRIFLP